MGDWFSRLLGRRPSGMPVRVLDHMQCGIDVVYVWFNLFPRHCRGILFLKAGREEIKADCK